MSMFGRPSGPLPSAGRFWLQVYCTLGLMFVGTVALAAGFGWAFWYFVFSHLVWAP